MNDHDACDIDLSPLQEAVLLRILEAGEDGLSDPELAALFGVSETVVREVCVILTLLGLIEDGERVVE
jgi:DNA-binding FadR family transcriptional regulator